MTSLTAAVDMIPEQYHSGYFLYICPVCPWTVDVYISLDDWDDDVWLEMVDEVVLDHLMDPGCNWDFSQVGGRYRLRTGASSVDRIHVDHALAGGHTGHSTGSMADMVCHSRRESHDRRWEDYLDGSSEAEEWWT